MVQRKFKGPVRPGVSEEKFRETGETVREFRGPVRPGTDVEKFRKTGISEPISKEDRRRGGRAVAGPTRADIEAEQRRVAEQKEARRQAEIAKRQAEIKQQQERKARHEQ